MHLAIENACSKAEIGLPSDYQQYMLLAHRSQPYHVTELNHRDIKNYDELNSAAMRKDAFAGIINAHHIIQQG